MSSKNIFRILSCIFKILLKKYLAHTDRVPRVRDCVEIVVIVDYIRCGYGQVVLYRPNSYYIGLLATCLRIIRIISALAAAAAITAGDALVVACMVVLHFGGFL